MRWPFILVGYVYSAVGYSINISNASAGVKYFGVFLCVAGTWSTIPGAIAWYAIPRPSTTFAMVTRSL